MIAFKWDPIWSKLSAFGLPWGPFALGSGYDVEDLDESEAAALGFKIPRRLDVEVKFKLDFEDLRQRFSAALADMR
jgi:hypothetical protein